MNALPSEQVAVLACIDPDAYGTGTYTTGRIHAALFERLQAVIMAGDLGSSATLNAKLIGHTASSGGTSADISGAAITALTQAGSDSNKQAIINLDGGKLGKLGYEYVELSMTVGTATSDCGALLLGFDPKYAPASDNDAASVDEIVSV
jgi:hypothetical protein